MRSSTICCRVESQSASVSFRVVSLRQIAFNRLYAARERIEINVSKQDLVAAVAGHLRNSVPHSACAYDAYCFKPGRPQPDSPDGVVVGCGAMSGSNRFPKSLKIEIVFRKAVALGSTTLVWLVILHA